MVVMVVIPCMGFSVGDLVVKYNAGCFDGGDSVANLFRRIHDVGLSEAV